MMKSTVTIVAFAGFCFAATTIAHPTKGEPLLDLVPSAPPSLMRGVTSAPVEEATVEVAVADFAALVQDTDEPTPAAPTAVSSGDEQVAAIGEPGAGELEAEVPDADAEPVTQADPRDAALRDTVQAIIDEAGGVPQSIVRPCLERAADGACRRAALDRYFEQLRLNALQEAERPARLSMWGDSLVVGDGLPADLRARFGAQFGNGGHGYVPIGVGERRVGIADVTARLSEQWESRSIIRGGTRDPLYGLAGEMFRSEGAPTFELRASATQQPFTRVGLLYFASTEGGTVNVRIGDASATTHTLQAARGASGLDWFDVPVDAMRFRLSQFQPGLRFYGVVAEADSGVVIDNLGLVSSRSSRLTNIDEEHWASQIALRDPDALAFFYGVNAAWEGQSSYSETQYREQYTELLSRARRVAPERDCLGISLLSRGSTADGASQVLPSIGIIHGIQGEVAAEVGCAFWSTYEAVGGDAGILEWRRRSRLGADMSHPTRAGYEHLGRMLYLAFLEGFVDYLDRRVAGHVPG